MSGDGIRQEAAAAQRIVVKVGSSVLTRDGRLRPRVFGDIARQVAALRGQGRDVVVVSSGAIAVGSRELGWQGPGATIPEKQAAAAVGQVGLVDIYRKRFAKYDLHVAQVLVTAAGLQERERFVHARHTLMKLLELGVVPIVNENDTVATVEISIGDNDTLSASVLNLVDGDLLVILSDVEGLHREPPRTGRPKPPLFEVIEAITPEIAGAARGPESRFGRGGMTTKLEAAQSAARRGAATVLCDGRARDALLRVAAGEPLGTFFRPGKRLASRKHWLAFTSKPRGELTLDGGAVRAVVEGGKSLLAAGLTSVLGDFGKGDVVSCVGEGGDELARGLSSYSSDELRRIAGLPARRIREVLGYSNGDEVIHRDHLVLLGEPPT